MNIYIFQWISDLGGADTRLKDLLKLLSKNKKYNICCIPNQNIRFLEKNNIKFYNDHGIDYTSWQTLPEKAEGIALSFCNFHLFEENWRIKKIKDMGLKFIWSNDMMWHTEGETKAIDDKMIDGYLYTSEFHKSKMSTKKIQDNTKEFIIPNYFDVDSYPFFKRSEKDTFTIGKHSRPDPYKFSKDFPLFYQNLGLKNPKYRVMGVDDKIKDLFRWYDFDDKWELLLPEKESALDFLNSLDVYIYNSHTSFIENQSRAIIEAALTGLPIIAPNKYNFPYQIINEETGFLCDSYSDYQKYSKELEKSFSLRLEMGEKASKISKDIWCNKQEHIDLWEKIFNEI